VVQIKVWRRLLVLDPCSLREMHGVIQLAMGWERIHLDQFCLRARCFGSWELSASLPNITLAALRLRRGARCICEYDLNIPRRHEVRFKENKLEAGPDKAYLV